MKLDLELQAKRLRHGRLLSDPERTAAPLPFRTDAAPAATPNRTRRPLSMAARLHVSRLRANGLKGPLVKTTPIVPRTLHHTKYTSSRTAKRKTPTQKKTLGKCKATKSRTKAERNKTKTASSGTHASKFLSSPSRL
jgi:hypothetical protein